MDNQTYLNQIAVKGKRTANGEPLLSPLMIKLLIAGAIMLITIIVVGIMVSSANSKVTQSYERLYLRISQMSGSKGPYNKYAKYINSSNLAGHAVRLETSVAKTSKSLEPLLDKLGVVNDAMKIIHGVWLDEEEIELLGAKGGSLIYCPSSNMFLADGITDIPAYLRAGATVALGSDGACGNNRISVLEEMRMVAILQKAKTCDALCVNYRDAYRMGTANGGRVLGEAIGRLEPDCAADFVGIALDDLSMQPLSKGGQLVPNIVYSLQPTAIRHVVVNGETTFADGAFTKIDESELLARIRETMTYLED